MSLSPRTKKILLRCLVVLVVLAVAGGWFGWYNFFREEPEPQWANQAERFKYGSIGAEAARGLPYYIWLVLPRVFPEYVPGPGGYKAFGLVWAEGKEMPVGFTKRVIGFPRVANNCAELLRTARGDPSLPHRFEYRAQFSFRCFVMLFDRELQRRLQQQARLFSSTAHE